MRKYITKASERIGVESTSRDGKRAQVVSYSTCENFIIRFCDGKEMKLKNWRYFIEGNFNYEKHFKAPRNREERIGEKKVMNNGLTAEVIEYRGSHDMDILFEDGGKRTGVSWRDFCIGSIAHPTISGGNVSQNELVLRFYLESLGFVRIPQRSKRSDRVGLEGPFSDILQVFQKSITKQYILEMLSGNGLEVSATIQTIRLGYRRIETEDKDGKKKKEQIIPVWDFIGTYSSPQTEQLLADADDLWVQCYLRQERTDSLLTINANDGTIVDWGNEL